MLEFLDNWRMSALKLQVLMGKVARKVPSINKEQILTTAGSRPKRFFADVK